jgi:AraC-like DNA-binding protein
VPSTCEKRPEEADGAEARANGAQVGGAQVGDLLDALRRVDPRTTDLARDVGMDLSELAQARPVPVQTIIRLFDEAERLTGDPRVGLHAGRSAEPRGPLAHLIISCARLEDALLRCRRFGPLLITTMRIDFRREGDVFVLEYDDPSLQRSAHLADYALMATLRTLQRAVGEDARTFEVRFRRSDVSGAAEIERTFGCTARFGQAFDGLLIPCSVALRKPHMANPLIAEQIERFAEALLPREVGPSSFTEQVVRTARTLLSAGVRAERRLVCKRLGLSERSLHRRLAEEGANFRDVRESVLWDLAEALVSDSDLKLDAVAASVGFNDAAAFSKAFKRRSGYSPIAYRRSRAALGTPPVEA